MSSSLAFDVLLPNGRTARAVRVRGAGDLPNAVKALGLIPPRLVLVLIGGADGLKAKERKVLRPIFADALVPIADELKAVVVDGGTRSGIMHLMGQARTKGKGQFPLVGMVVEELVELNSTKSLSKKVRLDANHTHFVFVPGISWGDESPWISDVTQALAQNMRSVTVLINGGDIAWRDVEQSLLARRPVIVVGGSGRTADRFASALRSPVIDENVNKLAETGLLHPIDIANGPKQLMNSIRSFLRSQE